MCVRVYLYVYIYILKGKNKIDVVVLFVLCLLGSYSMKSYHWRHISDECKDIIRRLLIADPRCR